MNQPHLEKVNYKGWPNCYQLSNGQIDLIVTTDVGPRIIRFGFVDTNNEFKEFEEMAGQTGGQTWHAYGGRAAVQWIARYPRRTAPSGDCR